MFSSQFLFPPPEYDDSLKQLCDPTVGEILMKACAEQNLAEDSLGIVYTVE